jgi:hypothetical protein
VQYRVAKDGIELIPARQRFAVHDVRVQPKLPRGLDLRSARINGDDLTPEIDQLFRKYAVAAAGEVTTCRDRWRGSSGCRFECSGWSHSVHMPEG